MAESLHYSPKTTQHCLWVIPQYKIKRLKIWIYIYIYIHICKYLLIEVKEESEKTGLKLIIQMSIMASSLITSWHIDGEMIETVTDFIFLDCKITADGDCSHESKILT